VSETRKLAAILVSDVVGYSRLAGANEDRILARLRTLRSDLIDPIIAVHHGRVVKRTGDGSIIEFRSVVDAVNCAIEVQRAMVERNAEVAPDKRIEFRIGIHVGDVVEESDGDLMGDSVNIAARLEGVAEPGGICLSEDAFRQVKARDRRRSKSAVDANQVFGEDRRCHTRSLPRLPGTPARPFGGSSCFWWFVLRESAPNHRALRVSGARVRDSRQRERALTCPP
jgi:class 3 adenylate cyclase